MDNHIPKNKTVHYLTPFRKINSKCINELKIGAKTIKFLKKSIGENLLRIGVGNDILDWHQKHNNKGKTKQVELYQTKKLLHNKENHQQNEKVTYRMGENICKLYIW